MKRAFVLGLVLSLFTTFTIEHTVNSHSSDVYSGTWSSPGSVQVQQHSSANFFAERIAFAYNIWNGYSKFSAAGVYWSDTININRQRVNLGSQGPWADALNQAKNWNGSLYGCWSCTWANSRIRINTDRIGSLSANMQRKVAVHEMGHAAGLKHPNTSLHSGSFNAVMKQGTLNYNTPQQHDIQALYSKYPY